MKLKASIELESRNNFQFSMLNFTFSMRAKRSDYFEARYMSNDLGRFICPDLVSPDPMNTQSFNRYVYCENNPMKYIDANGLIKTLIVYNKKEYNKESYGADKLGDVFYITNVKGLYNLDKESDIIVMLGHGYEGGNRVYLDLGEEGGGTFDPSKASKAFREFPKIYIALGCGTGNADITLPFFRDTDFGMYNPNTQKVLIGYNRSGYKENFKPFLTDFFKYLDKDYTIKNAAYISYYYNLYDAPKRSFSWFRFGHNKYKPLDQLTKEEREALNFSFESLMYIQGAINMTKNNLGQAH